MTAFYRKKANDKIWWVDDPETVGQMLFSFDKRKTFNLFSDYPQNLTKKQKNIFDRENPFWKDFFKGRE